MSCCETRSPRRSHPPAPHPVRSPAVHTSLHNAAHCSPMVRARLACPVACLLHTPLHNIPPAPRRTRPAARGTSRCTPVLATPYAGPCTCRLQAWRAFGGGSEAACIPED
ncbi:hypothetical protein GGX14DRAFT_565378 [Mycena pura]|uniref:Uncharacterized protein n=1 Tax=Mycena pura TaxID=153505 RepID=A0AAD6YBZ6_9AGAR|nr:hypothetical protein GGX14DRAFT_565378 [Mycena pura]